MSEKFEPDASLGADEVNRIYVAVLAGRPDPIGTEESSNLYAKLKAEIEKARKGTEWVVPND